MRPIELNKRIDILDYLRGFSLVGIILVNILALLDMKIPDSDTLGQSYQRFLLLFVEGRFFTIFSFLFGVGFYIFISRAHAKGKNGIILFIRRLIALFLFGVVHSVYNSGEALAIYAVFGLLILPFYKLKKEINLIVGLVLLILTSYLSLKALMPLPLILIGYAAGQYQFFEELHKKIRMISIFTAIMFVLSAIGLLIQYKHVPLETFYPFILEGVNEPTIEQANQFMKIGLMIGPLLSAFFVGSLILLLQLPLMQKVLSPLKFYGRMALTNYLMQTAFILIVGHMFDLFERISYTQSFFLCVGICLIQFIFSRIWLHFFLYGPMEWIWRMWTYFEVPSIVKSKEKPALD
ncbi:MAG TPA: DUF418 domain-containing protein [Sporosarcina psychrophila]|uniref:DUF418 domain-containing protein n=1 Tax=Sporosarcina psychrophila TaxID=1476 RepID=A0A921G5Q2_SPOPS|nr:DUF418 domain-containing protein [Sporosarcina psychrophila]